MTCQKEKLPEAAWLPTRSRATVLECRLRTRRRNRSGLSAALARACGHTRALRGRALPGGASDLDPNRVAHEVGRLSRFHVPRRAFSSSLGSTAAQRSE